MNNYRRWSVIVMCFSDPSYDLPKEGKMDWKSWWAGFISGAFAGFFLAGTLVQIFIEPQWGTSAEASAPCGTEGATKSPASGRG
jgi:hypothetical protein